MTSYIDSQQWPAKLTAHVVEPDATPRIHGYDVEADLARHYPFSTTVLLALSGELPDDATARAFDVALTFLAPAPVSQPPAHAAVLARVSGARTSNVLAAGAIGLCEQARFFVTEHADVLRWLSAGATEAAPADALARDDDDRAGAASLRRALEAVPLPVAALAHDLSRSAAVLAALHACGLRRPEQLETALVFARLPCVAAEAFAVAHGRFRDYPTNLPPFSYEAP